MSMLLQHRGDVCCTFPHHSAQCLWNTRYIYCIFNIMVSFFSQDMNKLTGKLVVFFPVFVPLKLWIFALYCVASHFKVCFASCFFFCSYSSMKYDVFVLIAELCNKWLPSPRILPHFNLVRYPAVPTVNRRHPKLITIKTPNFGAFHEELSWSQSSRVPCCFQLGKTLTSTHNPNIDSQATVSWRCLQIWSHILWKQFSQSQSTLMPSALN